MMNRDMSDNRGFTLIELVMVIVIIGILAAAALPRFANLTSQARTASNEGVGGAFRSAVMIAHAAWIASGANGTSVTLDGSSVTVSSSGWPNNGQSAATLAASDCVSIMTSILIGAPEVTAGTCTTTRCYVASTVALSGICKYTLDGAAATDTITYTTTSGEVSVP